MYLLSPPLLSPSPLSLSSLLAPRSSLSPLFRITHDFTKTGSFARPIVEHPPRMHGDHLRSRGDAHAHAMTHGTRTSMTLARPRRARTSMVIGMNTSLYPHSLPFHSPLPLTLPFPSPSHLSSLFLILFYSTKIHKFSKGCIKKSVLG